MRVLLINGSPNKKGCTNRALEEIAKSLNSEGVETEIFHIGNDPVRGCQACGACRNGLGCCVYDDDCANEMGRRMAEADGIIVGSPVYFAGPNGALCALLDRALFSYKFSGKPAAAIVSCRRAGSSAALDRLNKYFTVRQMPVVSSNYWNMVHGNTPEEVEQDLEGLQIMRVLGHNMATMLKSLQSSESTFVSPEEKVYTNFITIQE